MVCRRRPTGELAPGRRLDLRLTAALSLALVPLLGAGAISPWASPWVWIGCLLTPLVVWIVTRRVVEADLRRLAEREAQWEREKRARRHQLMVAERRAVLGRLASQVSHDIRSPLTALELLLSCLTGLPDAERALARQAVGRIKDIANSLLTQATALAGDTSPPVERETRPILLVPFIETILTEKRAQLRAKPGVSVAFAAGSESQRCFAQVCRIELGRALSNILDNAVEALGKRGTVRIETAVEGERARIIVRDSGRGIAPELLERLQSGESCTSGKAEGHGLGLSYVRQCVERWQGGLEIESRVGAGTRVTIELPLASPPRWLPDRISLAGRRTIVVLDDDGSFQEVWKSRLTRVMKRGFRVLAFRLTSQLCEWVNRVSVESSMLFLVDYELSSERIDGIRLIESLGIEKQAILVTARYDEVEIQQRCEKAGIPLLPKPLAAWTEIIDETGRKTT